MSQLQYIDPCLYQLSDGRWRMWYKDESPFRGGIWCADSSDLHHWKACKMQVCDYGEGPNVFAFGGEYPTGRRNQKHGSQTWRTCRYICGG